MTGFMSVHIGISANLTKIFVCNIETIHGAWLNFVTNVATNKLSIG